jgi:hypothetical protein
MNTLFCGGTCSMSSILAQTVQLIDTHTCTPPAAPSPPPTPPHPPWRCALPCPPSPPSTAQTWRGRPPPLLRCGRRGWVGWTTGHVPGA